MEQPTKKRRIHQQFVYERTFDTLDGAMEMVESENCWSKYYQTSSVVGKRLKFRCNLVKYHGEQCAASIYLLFESRSAKAHLHRSVDNHNHNENVNMVVDISDEAKAVISEIYELGITRPKRVLETLMAKNLPIPDKKLLIVHLKKLRKELYGNEYIDMVKLKNYLIENEKVPESKSEMFIVDYQISIDEETPFFRFLASSKQLLSFAINATNIHTDATYKLIWQGFPVLLVGTTDMRRKFHPFGVAVCTNERTEDFSFVFAALVKGVNNLFNISFTPSVLICDAAQSIHNGYREEFGGSGQIVMCWAHMRRKVVEKSRKFIRRKDQQIQLMNDIDRLQQSWSDDIFDMAVELFKLKWKHVFPEFFSCFESEWLNKNRYWYEGVRPLTPKTNNALESTNRIIKDEYTMRQRYDFGRFRRVLSDMIYKWSLAYENGSNEFHTTVCIELKMWTAAYALARENKPMTVIKSSSNVTYYLGSAIFEESYQTFDEFKKAQHSNIRVKFPAPYTRENWSRGSCNCCNYFKLYMCEHILSISMRMRYICAPEEAKSIPIGAKRKRGRPAFAKAALVYQ